MASRLAVVDDSDTNRIRYSGKGWSAKTFGDESTLTFGPSINGTAHELGDSEGSFSFLFNGSYVQALGTLDSTDGKTLPTWRCFIDGVQLPFQAPRTTGRRTNTNLCEVTPSQIGSGPHEFVMNVSSTSPGSFSLDWMAYTPVISGDPVTTVEETQMLYVPSRDRNITTSSGWGEGGVGHSTNTPDAELVLTFSGIGVQAKGFIPFGSNATKSSYSLNGAPFRDFDLVSSPNRELYNVLLFEEMNLPMQTHNLAIRYTGIPDRALLVIDHFFIYHPAPARTSVSETTLSTTPPPTSTALSTTPSAPTNNIGAIVGGAVGGVAALLVAVFLVICLLRRRRIRHSLPGQGSADMPDIPPVVPFTARPTMRHVSNSQNPTYSEQDSYRTSIENAPRSSGISSSHFSPLKSDGRNPPLSPRPDTSPSISSNAAAAHALPPGASPPALARMKQDQSAAVARVEGQRPGNAGEGGRRQQDSGMRFRDSTGDLPPLYTFG